jgi:hypothetical protein
VKKEPAVTAIVGRKRRRRRKEVGEIEVFSRRV